MKKFPFIFGGIGLLILLLSGFLAYRQVDFRSHAVKATGVVTQLEYHRSRKGGGTYRPVVRFRTADGQEQVFTSSAGSNPAGYEVGEEVEIWYNPQQPSEASLSGFFEQWGGSVITGGIGLVFALIGAGIWYAAWKRQKDMEWLQSQGTIIQADYLTTQLHTSTKINGRSPYRIHGQWLDTTTNKVYTLTSDNLWFDPSPFITSDKLRVWIDPRNPKKYCIDTSFLPQQG